jgi:hypothetical protein
MATNTPSTIDEHSLGNESDPAGEGTYDYVSDDIERPGLMEDLDARVDGDVRFDTYSFATIICN